MYFSAVQEAMILGSVVRLLICCSDGISPPNDFEGIGACFFPVKYLTRSIFDHFSKILRMVDGGS